MKWTFIALGVWSLLGGVSLAQGIAREGNITVLAAEESLAREIARQANSLRDQTIASYPLNAAAARELEMTISVRLDEDEERSLSFPVQGQRGTWYKISLVGKDAEVISAALRRELVKVLLTAQQDGELSPWIAAGIAGQSESGQRRESQAAVLEWFARTGNWPELRSLFAEEHLVDEDRAGLAAATDVVQLLLRRSDAKTLLAFADDAQLIGWDDALAKHYQIKSVAELETVWHAAAKQQLAPRISTAAEGMKR